MNYIIDALSSSNLRIGIIGDSMVDEYFNVHVRKISPEFPIPVMHSENEEACLALPGGAANVAYQLQHLNKNTFLCSFVDNHANQIMNNYNINTDLCVNIDPFFISRKKRFYSSDFPTYRWDVEKTNYGMSATELNSACQELTNKILSQNFDVLIFSDYDKGIFYNDIVSSLAEKHSCLLKIVDPKKDIEKWKGCTLIKPNTSEAFAITREKEKLKQLQIIKQKTNCKSVIITSEGDGFVGQENEYFEYINPKSAKQANSVIGAGDCFIAFLGLCMGNKINLQNAAEFAFSMGLIYVTEKHNKPLNIDIIKKHLLGSKSKIIDYKNFKERNFKLVVTNGCFDILHAGHISSLEFAKNQGDKLLVAVNSDESVSKIKPGRPINKLQHRMSMLAALECVDFVTCFDEDTPIEVMKHLNPDILVKGEDYIAKEVVGKDYAKKVIFCPLTEGLSTSNIIKNFMV